MARRYTITNGYSTVTRYRYDAAVQQAIKLTYDALAAQGQLDTKAGHKLYNEVTGWFNKGCSKLGNKGDKFRSVSNERNFFGPFNIKIGFRAEMVTE